MFLVNGCSGSVLNTYTLAINSIDSVLVGSNYHKRFHLTSGTSIIEGVGSTDGLLEKNTYAGMFDPYSSLICFTHNTAIYPSTSTSCTLVTNPATDILQLPYSTSNLLIFPNPTSDQFFIDANTSDKLTVDLFDVNGKRVFSASVNDKENIDIADLNVGVYSLTIKTADRVINKKLVIVR